MSTTTEEMDTENNFEEQIKAIQEKFIEQVRIACAEYGKDFKETFTRDVSQL